ncbi:MAG: methyltransferase domain-containing protein [Streptosporangiaceae bacterium]
MPEATTQSFGENPVEVRSTDHYVAEYVPGFVEKWDELIDWRKRAASEGSFFIDQLKARGAKKVLDVATGTGFHSVRLLEEGFEVVSADGSAEMLAKAFENGLKHGEHILRVVRADWRCLNRDVHGEYDAIICLGNSFTHLFAERDRRKALAEFYAMLKHDGILILDQRNYDAILDSGYSSTHTYYYCGDEVSAEPEHMDEGLARFRYSFPDDSVFYLNMFPLRKRYVRQLMREVGFQDVQTYGDFQETYREDEPDFFVHIAEKTYTGGRGSYGVAVDTAREYYDSDDADNFYFTVWGGEDIHVGMYDHADEPIFDASRRTVERMAEKVSLGPDTRVLDIGAGYGGAARYLARTYGCRVVALNLSAVENRRDRQMNDEQGLSHLIEVVEGAFENIPYPADTFDVVWSQDALLHSGDRDRVFEEVDRVLRSGGDFVFTDPMAADDCPSGVLAPIRERIHLETMGSPAFYRGAARRLGWQEVEFDDHSQQLSRHYGRVLRELENREDEVSGIVSGDYVARMKKGLGHWVEGGDNEYLVWGVFHFRA